MQIGSGTVVIVTGGARGLGRALVEASLARGAAVAAWDRDSEGLQQLAAAHPGGRLSTHVVDLGDPESVPPAAALTLQQHGTVDLLINNAAVTLAAPVEHMTLGDLQRVMDVNFWGAVRCTMSFLATLRARPAAGVINVLSQFALWGFPTKAAYCAAKFALRGFTESLQAECARTTLQVTAVYPGAIATDFVRDSSTWNSESRAAEAAFLARHGRPPQEVAAKILDAVEGGRRRVRIGLDAVGIDLLLRVAPATTMSLLGRWQHRVPFLRRAV